MKPTQQLHDLGQSLWVDNITRTMLDDGTLAGYIEELSLTGQTSNPTIFDNAIGSGDTYDEQISELQAEGLAGEELFFEIALTDINRAAKLFAAVNERTDGVDGRVSLEVSPLLADDADATIQQAADLYSRAEPNVFIKIPGTTAGHRAIEETIFAGIPVNVTLLFDTEHFLGSSEAYARGIERRIEAGLNPAVASVGSLFMSRWDVAANKEVPSEFHNRLALAVGKHAYRAYRELIDSPRWQRLMNEGARPQRLLWASTGTKDPNASDTLYIEGLASPLTVNTMPENTLHAFADHGTLGEPMPVDGGNGDEEIAEFEAAGVDVAALAVRLQEEGKESFNNSWRELLGSLESKREALA